MSIGIKQRAAAYLEAAYAVRAIDAKPIEENVRLEEIVGVLTKLAARKELFPERAFPRAPGSPGGLFRLTEFPDRRGAIYMSLGFTGRKQTAPHRHVSWAIVAGVSGGIETNVLYEFTPDESAENAAVLKRTLEKPVGPGDTVAIGSGVYHTIEVISDTPVLHLHAYGVAVDQPGYELPVFESEDARTYTTRATGAFRPPLSAVTLEDIADDVAQEAAVVLVLNGAIAPLKGPGVYFGNPPVLDVSAVPRETPVVLVGSDAEADAAAQALYDAGHPLVFRYVGHEAAKAAA